MDAHFKMSLLVVTAVRVVTSGFGDGYIRSDCVSHHKPSILTGLSASATLYSLAVVLSWVLFKAQECRLNLALPNNDLGAAK